MNLPQLPKFAWQSYAKITPLKESDKAKIKELMTQHAQILHVENFDALKAFLPLVLDTMNPRGLDRLKNDLKAFDRVTFKLKPNLEMLVTGQQEVIVRAKNTRSDTLSNELLVDFDALAIDTAAASRDGQAFLPSLLGMVFTSRAVAKNPSGTWEIVY